ncbi:MAG: hypothetical protein ACRDLP_11345 [Solirubrobacteraceae bacterium]
MPLQKVVPTGLPFKGKLLRHRALGTDACYRVVRWSDPTVEVEVVSAPALSSGTRLRLHAPYMREVQRHQRHERVVRAARGAARLLTEHLPVGGPALPRTH